MSMGSQIHANATRWDQVLTVVQVMDEGPWHSLFAPDHSVPPLAILV